MVKRVVLLVAILGLGGCRLAGGAPPSSQAAAPSASAVVVDQEAPFWCGFPTGTALSYAGRSTAAALNVQEGMPDLMSNHLADIYITRDKYGQGELHGRLVCLVLVDEHGWVEVTVHPEDGGRFAFPTEPTPMPSPLPPGFIQILTHCGLSYPRIEYDGGSWRFDIEDGGFAPPGWGLNSTVVQIKPGPDGPIVIGPHGLEWQLIPVDPNEEPPSACL